ncbi:hypothetical protein ACMD2_04970 [Ananas comosus]|uniref:Uncharacterized protein n=1 Tax=Ananas comosus TaxID=4615 RepID=A0A199UQW4_ANACO|nr:hypothetical protein ACMD2_04970 [Ananas comosus]
MKLTGPPTRRRRRRRLPLTLFLILLLLVSAASLALLLLLRISGDASGDAAEKPIDRAEPRLTRRYDLSAAPKVAEEEEGEDDDGGGGAGEEAEEEVKEEEEGGGGRRSCATVEEMGEAFAGGSEKESLRIRELIRRHFDLHGTARVRELPPHQFCKQGFVIGKASEAGFGNEMYKILSAAALSVILNRGLYPFGEYISYSNLSFTLSEVKHLWRKNDCAGKFGRNLKMRVDNFENPAKTNVLCSDWNSWKQPIIWFQGTTDAVGIQFFLKNINPGMRNSASILFGPPDSLQSRPNVFGELMRAIISPSQAIKEAVDWVLNGADPDISLHMRMLTNRSIRAIKAAVQCIKRALNSIQHPSTRPQIVLVSDTPSFIKEITPFLTEFAEVLHFDYKVFEGNISLGRISSQNQPLDFRVKDWGPAPRWVAFVDFFLASRAKHAVVSGAHRRVGTTYAQLTAALAAANRHGEEHPSVSSVTFLSSFQSNLLTDGLANQIGWGHIWNRFAGPLSCRRQPHQCALTPLLPPAWWDAKWQSPIPRDVRRLMAYGVRLTETGDVVESTLRDFCRSRKEHVKTLHILGQCTGSKCS